MTHTKHGPKIRELMIKQEEYHKKVQRLRLAENDMDDDESAYVQGCNSMDILNSAGVSVYSDTGTLYGIVTIYRGECIVKHLPEVSLKAEYHSKRCHPTTLL